MPSQVPQDSSPYSDPLILFASTTVVPGSAQGPNTDALGNPDNLDMDLLEVRWRIYPHPSAASAAALSCISVLGVAMGVKMDMGSIAIVDSDTPISLFGNARDIDETFTDKIYADPTNTSISVFQNEYRWRLKYPLLIPGGAVATPIYSHLGQIQFPVTIDTVYVCRQRTAGQRRPEQAKAPWVGGYNSIAFDNFAAQAAAQDTSTETDLLNPFDVPLEVVRLGGTCVLIPSASGDLIEWVGDHRYRLGKERMKSKRGADLARVPTTFNGLFPIEWRVWDIPGGWGMAPGEYYKIFLNVAAVDYTIPTSFLGPVQFCVSSIGYRDVPIKDFLTAAFGEVAK